MSESASPRGLRRSTRLLETGLSHTPSLRSPLPSAWWVLPPTPLLQALPSQALGSSSPFIALLHCPIVLPELPPPASVFLQQFNKIGHCLGLDTSQGPWAQCPGHPIQIHLMFPCILPFWDEAFVVGPFPSWGVSQWPLRVLPPPRVLTGVRERVLPQPPQGVDFHGLDLSSLS